MPFTREYSAWGAATALSRFTLLAMMNESERAKLHREREALGVADLIGVDGDL